jgi:hypothetical protein
MTGWCRENIKQIKIVDLPKPNFFLCKTHHRAELFGPGHFVGLGLKLRLKSEIRTRAQARTKEIVTFLHLDPKLSVNEILMTF